MVGEDLEGTSSPFLVLAASVMRGLISVCLQHPLVESCTGGKIAFVVCSAEGRENNKPSQSRETRLVRAGLAAQVDQ